jgi:hypothetical protein
VEIQVKLVCVEEPAGTFETCRFVKACPSRVTWTETLAAAMVPTFEIWILIVTVMFGLIITAGCALMPVMAS